MVVGLFISFVIVLFPGNRVKMKKVVLFAFLLAAFCAGYAQTTDSISTEIQGVVPVVFTLSTDMNDIETVDLVNSNSAYLGKVVVYSNTKGLWTIIIKSQNNGNLVGRSPNNNDVYPYEFQFGSVDSINLSRGFRMTYSTLVEKATVEYPVSISYKRLTELEKPVRSDTYSDIVTITITIS